MNFTLVYSDESEAFLAEIWLKSQDRAEITWAQNKIDRILGANPFEGVEVRERLFALIVLPLKVYYEINQED